MNELKTLLPYLRAYRRGLVYGLTLVVITNLFGIAAPYLVKLAIDGLADPDLQRGTILLYALGIVAAAVLGGASKFGMRELLNGVSRKIECDLRNDFFEHLMRLDSSFYGASRTGDLMARATNDTLAVRMATGPAIMYAVNTAVGFVLALSLMLWISPRLTLIALLPLIALPHIVIRFSRVIHQRFEQIQEQFSTVSTMVQENLTGVRIVRAYSQERTQETQFSDMNQAYMDSNMSLARISGLMHPLIALFAGGAMVLVLWIGGLQVIAGSITVGDFVAFGIYLALLVWPMIALGWVVSLFQRGAASMGRINRILETEPAIAAPPDVRPMPPEHARIEFQDVSFVYPDTERVVLDSVSFVVHSGQTIAIVGPTGAGKSSLVSLIPRIYDPTGGQILLDGIPTGDLDPGELRRRIGMVPQDPFLFSTTIEENIGLGMDWETEAWSRREARELQPDGPDEDVDGAVAEAAQVAQMDSSIRQFPKGYGTFLGERGINLSGGQKQRATLARAVARDPDILILDDALSAVDTHTESKILADLRRVMANRTSFIISHRVSAVMHADLILVLDQGSIVERGRHAELAASGGIYASLLRRQMLEQDLEELTPRTD